MLLLLLFKKRKRFALMISVVSKRTYSVLLASNRKENISGSIRCSATTLKPKRLEVAEAINVVKKRMRVSACSACFRCLAATCNSADSVLRYGACNLCY